MTKLEKNIAAAYYALAQEIATARTMNSAAAKFYSGFPYKTEARNIVDFQIVEKFDAEGVIVEFYVRFLEQKNRNNVLLCSTPFDNPDFVIPVFTACAESIIADDY